MKKVGGETRGNINSHIEKAEALNILYEDIMYIINEFEKCQQSLKNTQQIVNEDENIGSTRLGTLKTKLEKIKKELQQPPSGGKSKPKPKSKTKKKKNYKKKTRKRRKNKRNKRRKTYKKKK